MFWTCWCNTKTCSEHVDATPKHVLNMLMQHQNMFWTCWCNTCWCNKTCSEHVDATPKHYLNMLMQHQNIIWTCWCNTKACSEHVDATPKHVLNMLMQHQNMFWTCWCNTKTCSEHVDATPKHYLNMLMQHQSMFWTCWCNTKTCPEHVDATPKHVLNMLMQHQNMFWTCWCKSLETCFACPSPLVAVDGRAAPSGLLKAVRGRGLLGRQGIVEGRGGVGLVLGIPVGVHRLPSPEILAWGYSVQWKNRNICYRDNQKQSLFCLKLTDINSPTHHRRQNKCYPKGVYLPISKLHSISAVANLLAHNNISQICYCGQISLQSAAVNFGNNIYFAGRWVTFTFPCRGYH